MNRRRAMMSRKAEPEQWDYVLLPNANGVVERTAFIDVPTGTKVTIEWDATGFDGSGGRYVFRTSLSDSLLNGTYYRMESNLPNITGQMRFWANRTMTIAFGGYSTAESTRFQGFFLKVRIG